MVDGRLLDILSSEMEDTWSEVSSGGSGMAMIVVNELTVNVIFTYIITNPIIAYSCSLHQDLHWQVG